MAASIAWKGTSAIGWSLGLLASREAETEGAVTLQVATTGAEASLESETEAGVAAAAPGPATQSVERLPPSAALPYPRS